ncbi:synaptotagmin-like protein 2 isoform X1 [Brienomyrus brachyistius]|uniref:synaptotagmin-like protein 2 isoform X1 n=1 Tax=Brienomyrus brachyistius TaxID=42636 RepID=UPI0020B375D6|nr:synaptotagmin-like protein 2 isoform X1 [Brienomyrus brachyistius]XP_048873490.1 synaptotagmin-like protein 2 isoform X1 [Brienomyrus brachyistius]
MLDLSYLTAQEQEMIMAVLKRDTELKRAEDQRVRKLQRTLKDQSKLKHMTGEWFYESRRHQGKAHGSDIISRSIMQKKPATLLELTQTWDVNPSFVNSKNKEVFIPAELSGLIEELPSPTKEERGRKHFVLEETADKKKLMAPLSAEQKQTAMNTAQLGAEALVERDGQLTSGTVAKADEGNPGCHVHSSPVGPGNGEHHKRRNLAARQAASRPMSISKSLMDITSTATPPTVPPLPASFSDPEPLKNMCKSVPAFVLEENGAQSPSPYRRDSSFTMRSGTSGVTSLSSVTGSVMSIYSGDFGSVDVKGTIKFAISYVPKLGEFHIFVVQCLNLAVGDTKKNRSDPYVKSYLLPDKSRMGKRKTSVKKKTSNPTYNEILRYKVDMETLKTQTLNVSVWHNDTFGRNSFLGEVDVDLSKWDFSNMKMNDFLLKPRSASSQQPLDYRGEIRLALRYLPHVSHNTQPAEMGDVQIWVKDCKDLPMIRGAAIDPFVKGTMLPDTGKKSCQKTRVLKGTSNPEFNHTMVYNGLRPADLGQVCMEITVWDHERLSNSFLGGLRLGLGKGTSYGTAVEWMDSKSDEANLWERMMNHHNEWVDDVLHLRMLLMAKSMSK